MKTQKLTALLLAFVMVFSMAACGDNDDLADEDVAEVEIAEGNEDREMEKVGSSKESDDEGEEVDEVSEESEDTPNTSYMMPSILKVDNFQDARDSSGKVLVSSNIEFITLDEAGKTAYPQLTTALENEWNRLKEEALQFVLSEKQIAM